MTERPKKLAGFAAIGNAFKFVFGNIPHLIATSILTLFVVLIFQFIYTYFTIDAMVDWQIDFMTKAYETGQIGNPLGIYLSLFSNPMTATMSVLSIVISLVFGGIFAIRWHRSALFGTNADNTGFGLEFSPSLQRYVINAVIISLIAIAIMVVPAVLYSSSIATTNFTMMMVGSVLILVGLVVVIYVSGRLSLALPSAALEIPDFGIGAAWKASDGYGWDIFWAMVVMTLACFAVAIPIGIIAAFFTSQGLGSTMLTDANSMNAFIEAQASAIRGQMWMSIVINAIFYPLFTGLYTSLFSYIYFQIGTPPAWVREKHSA